jgi:hypothetical protein
MPERERKVEETERRVLPAGETCMFVFLACIFMEDMLPHEED